MVSRSTVMSKEILMEEYEIIMVKLAMTSYAEQEGKLLIKENEGLKNIEEYNNTDVRYKKFIRRMDKYFLIKSWNIFANKLEKYMHQISAIIILAIVVLFTSTITVEAFRTQLINLMISKQKEYTNIKIEDNQSGNVIGDNLYINWSNAYAPTYIPDGFGIANLNNNKNSKIIEYKNESGNQIWFNQLSENTSISLDTENAENLEEILINNSKALLIEKDELVSLIWYKDNHLFKLMSIIDEDEIIKIAESVRYLK